MYVTDGEPSEAPPYALSHSAAHRAAKALGCPIRAVAYEAPPKVDAFLAAVAEASGGSTHTLSVAQLMATPLAHGESGGGGSAVATTGTSQYLT